MPVIDPVWELLDHTYGKLVEVGLDPATIPSCLERDFNFPPLQELVDEVAIIDEKQRRFSRVFGQQAAARAGQKAVVA